MVRPIARTLAGTGRGGPLATRDARFQESLAQLAEQVPALDVDAIARQWQAALDTPEWSRPPIWLHGDIHPGNLLEVDGRLSAVIDWGDLAVGDPAIDCLPAWCLFDGESPRPTDGRAMSTTRPGLAVEAGPSRSRSSRSPTTATRTPTSCARRGA